MVRLAMECGILNENGLTTDEQRQVDIQNLEMELALYAWHYYVLDTPDVSDKEYDYLKAKYLDMRKILKLNTILGYMHPKLMALSIRGIQKIIMIC